MGTDLRHALRSLRRSPAYTAAVVLVLALGIGASAAMFSVVRGVLLAPLPYSHPARLFAVSETEPAAEHLDITWRLVNPLHFARWQRDCPAFAGLAMADQGTAALNSFGQRPQQIEVGSVNANFLSLLGVRPRLGRDFLASEDRPRGDNAVILSDSLWRHRFAASPAIVGRVIAIDNSPYTVVGVLPASFRWPLRGLAPDLLEPLGVDWTEHTRWTGDYNFKAIARLRPGATPEQARAQLATVETQIATRWMQGQRLRAVLTPLGDALVGAVRTGLLLLLGAVLAVLLIGCVNLANLTLARMSARSRVAAIQAALGASRGQLLGSLLTENLLLAALGGLGGWLFAAWGISGLLWLAPPELPRLNNVHLNGWVLLFAAGLALLSGLAFGFWPAWRMSRADPRTELRGSGRGAGEDCAGRRLGQILVGLEVGLSAALLIAAGLLIHSFAQLAAVPSGFDSHGVLTVALRLPYGTYHTSETVARFEGSVLAKVRALPGVRAASFITPDVPLSGDTWFDDVHLPGDQRPEYELPEAQIRFVRTGYFATLGIPILRGRDFSAADRAAKGNLLVAIVSREMARELWPRQDALGRTFFDGTARFRVVGIAGDVLASPGERPPVVAYEPAWLFPWTRATLAVRGGDGAAALASAIRGAVWSVDATVPVPRFQTMAAVAAAAVGERAFQMRLMLVFALAALLLAALGVYGVISYSVSRRTAEIGLRAALGAHPGSVARLVLRQGLRPVAWGLGGGIIAALLTGRALASLLFQVRADDPWSFALASLTLAVAAILACWLPARRAAAVAPAEALRWE